MTDKEFAALQAKIEERYQKDLAALDRILELFRGVNEPPGVAGQKTPGQKLSGQPLARQKSPKQKLSVEEKRERQRQRAYYRAWAARKKAGTSGVKDHEKFLVSGADGNGER